MLHQFKLDPCWLKPIHVIASLLHCYKTALSVSHREEKNDRIEDNPKIFQVAWELIRRDKLDLPFFRELVEFITQVP